MALYNSPNYTEAQPKKTRQGKSQNTKLSAARNGRKKRYRGQGK